jgi:predicted outer membrane repeat protein
MNKPIFKSWSDFYPDQPIFVQLLTNKFYSQIESGHYYSTSSYFLDLSQDGSGGALSFTSNTEKYILIEKVYFYNYSSKTGSGGAVYFTGLISLIFHQICSFHCYLMTSNQYGAFC